MKLSKEELKKKVSEIIGDDETAITVLEDIEDSMNVAEETDSTAYEELKAKYEELNAKYEELKTKYKERFISGTINEDLEKSEETEELEEVEEEEVIDVKEI